MPSIYQSTTDLFIRGGYVMWPLLGLSVLSLTLIFERCWFWIATNHPGNLARLSLIMRMLRTGDMASARALAMTGRGVYNRIALMVLEEPGSEAAAAAAVESQRPKLERYMPTLSTVITAAPMLGILGTVTGIISSFKLLSQEAMTTTDPRLVSQGISEALLTTAAGLIVALVVLFPYNAFRAQIDRTMSRIEALIAAAHRESVAGPQYRVKSLRARAICHEGGLKTAPGRAWEAGAGDDSTLLTSDVALNPSRWAYNSPNSMSIRAARTLARYKCNGYQTVTGDSCEVTGEFDSGKNDYAQS